MKKMRHTLLRHSKIPCWNGAPARMVLKVSRLTSRLLTGFNKFKLDEGDEMRLNALFEELKHHLLMPCSRRRYRLQVFRRF